MTRLSSSEEKVKGEGLVGLAGVLVWGSKLVYAARVLRTATPDIVPNSKRYPQTTRQANSTYDHTVLFPSGYCLQATLDRREARVPISDSPLDALPTRLALPALASSSLPSKTSYPTTLLR